MSDVENQVSLDELNGRIEEIELQRTRALTRCAKLAGEKAQLIRLLEDSRAEMQRLSDQLEKLRADAS